MTTDRTDDAALSPELEAIAAAARDRLHAQTGQDLSAIDQAARRVAEAASAAIAAGGRLSAIADAERDGELRARQELSGDVLRHVTRAAKRKRDTDTRIRAGHRPHRPTRTLPPRDRRRRPGLARHRPRDPHPRQHHHRQRAASRGGTVRRRAGRARRIPADRHLPAVGTSARGPASGAPSARRSSCAPRSPRSASHSVRSYPSARAWARSTMLPRTPAARRSAAIRAAASRPARSQSNTTDTRRPANSGAHSRLPRRHRRGRRSRAARASGR